MVCPISCADAPIGEKCYAAIASWSIPACRRGYCSFAYSALACFRMEMSGQVDKELSSNNFSDAAMFVRKKRIRTFRLEEGCHSRRHAVKGTDFLLAAVRADSDTFWQ